MVHYRVLMEPRPSFDFKDGADSIAISGHKFIGSPIPCGVVITKKSHKDRIAKGISYIGSLDTTITGSRNGHSPLYLWYALKHLGLSGLKERYEYSLSIANYCKEQMANIGIPAWSNQNAITVVIPKMPKSIQLKWQLATEGDITQIICMPNVTKDQIDELITDIQNCEVTIDESFEFDF